jgi:hypothetical protein
MRKHCMLSALSMHCRWKVDRPYTSSHCCLKHLWRRFQLDKPDKMLTLWMSGRSPASKAGMKTLLLKNWRRFLGCTVGIAWLQCSQNSQACTLHSRKIERQAARTCGSTFHLCRSIHGLMRRREPCTWNVIGCCADTHQDCNPTRIHHPKTQLLDLPTLSIQSMGLACNRFYHMFVLCST